MRLDEVGVEPSEEPTGKADWVVRAQRARQ